MKGNCEDCARRDTCKKSIGFMFGFCNTDFVPAEDPARGFDIPTIDKSLRRDVESGEITIEDAARELARAGWNLGIVDVEFTRNFLYPERRTTK